MTRTMLVRMAVALLVFVVSGGATLWLSELLLRARPAAGWPAEVMAIVEAAALRRTPEFLQELVSAGMDRVVDGDTIIVRLEGQRVRLRLIGIDTPETKHPDRAVEPWGPEATAFLARLLADEAVLLEWDEGKEDRHGRRLAYVYTPAGVFVNGLMVRAGLASALVVPPNTRYTEWLEELQGEARRERLGIWAGSG